MAVNTILVDAPRYYGLSGSTLELRANYDFFNFIPAVGDKVLVKNTNFESSYDPLYHGQVTDIYITQLGEDTQYAEYNATVHTPLGSQLWNLLASSTGVEFTVTAVTADPDDAGKQLLTLQAPLLNKAVGLDGARFIRDKIKAKQDKLTAGTNISIAADGKTISATDTTYSDFTGATSSVAGSAGLVPAPTTSDPDKFLKGDGTWATVASGETTTIFYWDAPNSAMYKDSSFTTAATMSDVEAAASAGPVKIYSANIGKYEYLVSDRIFAGGHFSTVWADNNGNLKSVAYTYPSDTWVRTSVNVQKQLTAGSNITIAGDGTISATDTTYSNFTGATSSVAGAAGLVPAPAAGDEAKALHGDGTWKDTTAKLVEMSYGEANAWAKFIAAYNAGSIVYCRASSNANPASGSQTRKAFMAYVNNAANPTEVEFQYVRSVSSKTSSQPVDQVFVYKLTSSGGGTWTVQTRDMAPKIAAGAGISVSYSNGTYTISLASTDGQGGASD